MDETIYPERVTIRAPAGVRRAIAAAARAAHQSHSEWHRQSLLKSLADAGVPVAAREPEGPNHAP